MDVECLCNFIDQVMYTRYRIHKLTIIRVAFRCLILNTMLRIHQEMEAAESEQGKQEELRASLASRSRQEDAHCVISGDEDGLSTRNATSFQQPYLAPFSICRSSFPFRFIQLVWKVIWGKIFSFPGKCLFNWIKLLNWIIYSLG